MTISFGLTIALMRPNSPKFVWWAQVDSIHSPTYRVFITLCVEALVRLTPAPKKLSFFGGLKWTRTTDLALIRRAL